MNHLSLHQVDIAEVVEPLAERGLTVKLIYQLLLQRFCHYRALTLFQLVSPQMTFEDSM